MVGPLASVGTTTIRYSPIGLAVHAGVQLTGNTLGGCVNAQVDGVGFAGAGLCYVDTPDGGAALTGSAGTGATLGGLGASLTGGPTVLNARTPGDVTGEFTTLGLSGSKGSRAGSVSYAYGKNCQGRTIQQVGAGVGVGLESDSGSPVSVSAGKSDTAILGRDLFRSKQKKGC